MAESRNGESKCLRMEARTARALQVTAKYLNFSLNQTENQEGFWADEWHYSVFVFKPWLWQAGVEGVLCWGPELKWLRSERQRSQFGRLLQHARWEGMVNWMRWKQWNWRWLNIYKTSYPISLSSLTLKTNTNADDKKHQSYWEHEEVS